MLTVNNITWKPVLFSLNNPTDAREFEKLVAKKLIAHISDDYEEQLRELFAVRNPALIFEPDFEEKWRAYCDSITKKISLKKHGVWAYFPWISLAAHIL